MAELSALLPLGLVKDDLVKLLVSLILAFSDYLTQRYGARLCVC